VHVGEDRRTPGVARVSTSKVLGHREFEHLASDQRVQVLSLLNRSAAESQVGHRRDQGEANGKRQALIAGRGGDGDREVAADRIAEQHKRLRVHCTVRDKPGIGAQAVLKGAREPSFGGDPIVHHVHSGVAGQSNRGGQRQIAFRRGATDVSSAVKVEHSAIGPADPWFKRGGRDTAQLTCAA
jgi:hypothetical protein